MLPVEELTARLRDVFPALTGGPRTAERHRTLRAAADWSHRLLTEPDQLLFRRLSVFRGCLDLAAAERVTAGAPLDTADVLEVLTRLVDRSLVWPTTAWAAFPPSADAAALRAERLAASGKTPATAPRM